MRASSSSAASPGSSSSASSSSEGSMSRDLSSSSAAIRTRNSVVASRSSSPAPSRCSTYASTTSAKSTSSRSTSSLSTSVSSRSNGPWKTSRSRSSEATRIAETLGGRPDAHALAHLGERAGGDRLCLAGTLGEHRLQLRLVRTKLAIALAGGRQVVDHGLGDGLLEPPVAPAVELALDLLRRHPAHHREDLDQVADPRLSGAPQDVGAGIRDRALDLLHYRRRLVQHADHAQVAGRRRRHL